MSNYSELEVDFETYVAPDHEFRSRHKSERDLTLERELAAVIGYKRPRPTFERELVALGKPKLVRPKRRALDLAVGLLLQTPVPRWNEEVQNRGELAHLERNALAVAKYIGLLNAQHAPYAQYRENANEPLESCLWKNLERTGRQAASLRRPQNSICTIQSARCSKLARASSSAPGHAGSCQN